MPKNSIYVVHEREKDFSRWLTIGCPREDWLELKLENLRHPGMVSNINRVLIPRNAMLDVLKGGFIQAKMHDGYGTLTGGETVTLSIKGTEDLRAARYCFDADEFREIVLQSSSAQDRAELR